MLVKDILASKKTGRLVTVGADATLDDAVQVMAGEKIGSIMVVDAEGALVGIFSERDLVRLVAGPGPDVRAVPIAEVASTSVITCREENTLEDILTLMSNHTIRHLPVTRDGKLIGMVSARDLMDAQKAELLAALNRQKQAAALMRRARDHAEQANRTKTEFMNRMSHELRTPLHAIIGFSEMIHGERLGKIGRADYVEYAGEIALSGRQLLKAIDDILAITRLESGRRQVEDAVLEPTAHLSACLQRFSAEAEAKNIDLKLSSVADGRSLIGDVAMLDRMLDNLVSNAIKFTPAGGRVTLATAQDARGDLLITVTDSGVGIDPESLDGLFTPFSQVDGALDREYGGMGLGLALVKMMIDLHEGAIDLVSEPGAGTTVTLRFPSSRVTMDGAQRASAI